MGGRVVAAGDKPELGISVPAGEVLYVGGQNTDEHGMYASEFTAALALLAGKGANLAKLRQGLLDGLRDLAEPGAHPATSQFLGNFIADLGKDAAEPVDIANAGVEDIHFTGLQSWLLWLGLAGGFAQDAKLRHDGKLGPSASPSPDRFADLDTTSTTGCSASDNTGEVLDWSAIRSRRAVDRCRQHRLRRRDRRSRRLAPAGEPVRDEHQ